MGYNCHSTFQNIATNLEYCFSIYASFCHADFTAHIRRLWEGNAFFTCLSVHRRGLPVMHCNTAHNGWTRGYPIQDQGHPLPTWIAPGGTPRTGPGVPPRMAVRGRYASRVHAGGFFIVSNFCSVKHFKTSEIILCLFSMQNISMYFLNF